MLTGLLLHPDNQEAERDVILFLYSGILGLQIKQKIVAALFKYVHSMKVAYNVPPKASKCRKM